MDHLGAGIGLLRVVGDGDGIEFADGIVALQDAGRILPGDRRAGLDLGPADLRIVAPAGAPLGDEIVDAALAGLVAGIPVLHRRIFDLGILQRHQFDDGGMELVLVAHRRRATFEIGDVAALVGDDQRALELPGVLRVDAEVGRQFHRAVNAGRDVDERPVGKDRRIQRRIEIVGIGHDGAEIFAHQLRMVLQRLGDRAEDDAVALQLLLEGGGDRDRIEHGVDRDLRRALHAGEHLLLLQRNAELLVGAQQFRIDLVEALRPFRVLGRGVVVDVLEVDRRIVDHGPGRLGHGQPVAVGLEPPVEHPVRLVLAGRDEADDVLVQPLRGRLHLDLGFPAMLVLAEIADLRDGLCSCRHD